MERRDVMSRPDRRATDPGAFSHAAFLYQDEDEYLGVLDEFAGVAADGPVQAVLSLANPRRANAALSAMSPRTLVTDMAGLGRNPARLIPAGLSFASEYPGEHVRCLWEPAWPDRSPEELTEIARHEALCNLAFADQPMTLLCLYDVSQLSEETMERVEATHPVLISARRRQSSATYPGAGVMPPGCDEPLPEPRQGAESLGFTDHLAAVRVFAARHATAAGLSPARTRDLTLAVSEIAANALGYASGGTIRAWRNEGELICQIEDAGHIRDPLAGYRKQSADVPGGHGLWLVNLVCDLVERRTGETGTVTRLHMRVT